MLTKTLFSYALCKLFLFICRLRQIVNKHLKDCLQSCRDEGWSRVAKFLTEDVPQLLKSEDLEDIQEVLSVVFKPPPSELRGLITWIAEVRRQEDGNLTLSDKEKGRIALKVLTLLPFWFLGWG